MAVGSSGNSKKWQNADKGRVHDVLFQEVARYEEDQNPLYERFAIFESLYDPLVEDFSDPWGRKRRVASRNLVASHVDTMHATLTASSIRARFLTEGADWKMQRRAEHLSWYAEALAKKFKVRETTSDAVKLGGLKGTGLVKCDINRFRQIQVTNVNVDDLVVNPRESKHGCVRQLHHAQVRSRAELAAEYPKHAESIWSESPASQMGQRLWAAWREVGDDQMAIWESWYLPIGVKGEKGFKPGRHVVCTRSVDLLDEEWDWDFFPIAEFRFSKRPRGWHGIGLAERLEGHQRVMDKYQRQVDLMLDKHAVPTTYLAQADANIAIKTTNRAGTFIVTKTGQAPTTVIPPAVSPELYQRENYIEEASFRDTGLSRLTATGMRPAGLPESGVGLREYRDATSERFVPQEFAREQLYLQTIVLIVWCCKRLGKDAPVVERGSWHGPQQFEWDDVDMGEVAVQIVAASELSQTPSGRSQFVVEMAQGGVISQDVARKLLMPHSPLDVEHEMSLYTAALKSAESHINAILDGAKGIVPEPYQNARMNVWRGTASLLHAEQNGAPEDILEELRQWVVQSAWIVSQTEAANASQMAGDPAAAMAGAGVTPTDPGIDPGTAMAGAGVSPMQLAG